MALKSKNITIYGNGKQSRTFCYIDDSIDAITNCLKKNMYVNEIVNIGNNKIITIIDLSKKIIKISKSNSKITYIKPLKEGDMRRSQPDITKMKKLLNKRLTSLKEGLFKTLYEQKYKIK